MLRILVFRLEGLRGVVASRSQRFIDGGRCTGDADEGGRVLPAAADFPMIGHGGNDGEHGSPIEPCAAQTAAGAA
ncbi:MAG TPA: hypothetical protein RMF84_20745, partial [Polyangiaceae bacterium LLY-WYZ-14_1]|nr:hypothetical protein [Polyangiaceae bacterium LLY-WYZ-14_1]